MKQYIRKTIVLPQVLGPAELKPGETSLQVLGLDVRIFNFFGRHGIYSVERMAEFSYEDLLSTQGVGIVTANQVRSKMLAAGFKLKHD